MLVAAERCSSPGRLIPYENTRELAPNRGSKIAILGPLGRGVLRFSKKGYRNPVHILAKIAIFHQNLPF